MHDNVQEIKSRLSVADALRSYIQLIPAGKNMKALCPFHKEKTPSFMVSPDRDMWYCFGCAEGGDIFKFVMKFENVEFFEALKILGEKAGVEIKTDAGAAGDTHKQLYEINRLAKDFFCSQLRATQSAYADSAKKYLETRSLKPETAAEFEIGLAPTAPDALLRFLVTEKKTPADIERAGLVFKSERGTYWDRFRGRLMFPLYNNSGKVVGFTGRILPSDVPASGFDAAKYVNSSETPIFNKSKILYGFHLSKNYIRDTRTAVIVEGQMDFLMMWADGVRNVIASSGTALTAEHLGVIRRIADNLILGFDSDPAGLAAAERSIDLASSLDFNVKVLEIKGFKDPADVVAASPGAIAGFVAASVPAMEHYFERYVTGTGDISERKKNLRIVLGKIKSIASAVERDHFVRALAMRSGVAESSLMEEMASLKIDIRAPSAPQTFSVAAEKEKQSRKDIIERRIAEVIAVHPELRSDIGDFVEHVAPLAELAALRASLDPGALKKEESAAELKKLIREFKIENIKEKQEKLRGEISSLERAGGGATLEAAQREFDSVSKELHNII